MTISSPSPFTPQSTAKRKYSSNDDSETTFSSPSHSPFREEISPRVLKKFRPKTVNPQTLRAKTVSRLFQGQRNYDRGDVDVEMTSPDECRCAFCDSPIDSTVPEEEHSCLQCTRNVCGKCGIRQYLAEGDYVACLECIQHG